MRPQQIGQHDCGYYVIVPLMTFDKQTVARVVGLSNERRIARDPLLLNMHSA